MEHSTEILYNRTRVYCSAVHRFGSDALLLARFSEPKRAWRAADLCSGCGIVSLEWHDRGHRGPCLGLELQPEASALLAAACTEQDIEHITPVCADLRSFREGEGSYDLCACNPPYFTAGEQAADRARATARHGDGLHAGRCLQMRVPAAEGWRAALALPPARAAGRGAGGPAGQPAGAQAAGLCEEPAGCRPLAVSGGSTEKPKNRAAGRAGCAHLGRRGNVWTLNLSNAARQVRAAAPGRGGSIP